MSHVPPTKRHPYDQWAPDARALDLVGDKWTLLIARDLMSGPRRFVELQRVLPGISTEQLRSRLNRMVADGLLSRSRYREVPPRVDYALTDRGRELAPVLGELARWGWRWAWGEPRASERVDVGAIVRLLPGLTQAGAPRSGTVELAISDARDGGALLYLATLREDGPATIRELQTAGESCVARVSGDTDAWVRALGPGRQRSALRISGDRALASTLLELISPPR